VSPTFATNDIDRRARDQQSPSIALFRGDDHFSARAHDGKTQRERAIGPYGDSLRDHGASEENAYGLRGKESSAGYQCRVPADNVNR
jgi:hypothetical protein